MIQLSVICCDFITDVVRCLINKLNLLHGVIFYFLIRDVIRSLIAAVLVRMVA